MCVAAAEPASGLRDTVPVGVALSMTAGSGAKSSPRGRARRALAAPDAFTDRALDEVRRRGWAQSVAEREAGVASVSAPVRGADGRVAAVSVSGPIDRIGRRPGARWAEPCSRPRAEALHHWFRSALP